MEFPQFTYHPDPLKTGAFEETGVRCPCCLEKRGYRYTDDLCSIPEDISGVCPWCIASGAAAKKYKTQTISGIEWPPEIPQEVIHELEERTPDFASWQGSEFLWQFCCNDVCEFHGDLAADEMKHLSDELKRKLQEDLQCTDQQFEELRANYEPSENCALSIYKFVCRHCKSVHLPFDLC